MSCWTTTSSLPNKDTLTQASNSLSWEGSENINFPKVISDWKFDILTIRTSFEEEEEVSCESIWSGIVLNIGRGVLLSTIINFSDWFPFSFVEFVFDVENKIL